MSARQGILALAYLVVAVVGVTVLAVSAYYLWRLADLAGMPPELAWTLPVALDAGAIGATVCWVAAPGRAKQWGQGIALGALAGTVSGNILAHLIDFGMLPVTPALVIGIGGVYPAVLWLMVHLALVLRTEQRDTTDAETELADARTVRAKNAAEEQAQRAAEVQAAQAHAAEMGRLRDEAQRAEREADEASQRAASLTTSQATSPSTSRTASPKRRTKSRKSTADERQAWIAKQLDKGLEVVGADVKRQFPDTTNGARDVATVKARREQRPVLTAVAKEA